MINYIKCGLKSVPAAMGRFLWERVGIRDVRNRFFNFGSVSVRFLKKLGFG